MQLVRSRTALALACGLLALAASAPAHAGGCNGVVNIFQWGCAPWDNNNGAKFPYYKKTVIQLPRKDVQIVSKNGSNAALYQGTYYPLISQDGGGLVASGGGNISVYKQQ